MRVVVVGTSGSGKTTLAKRIAAELGLPRIELDSLYWRPGWQASEPADFARRVAAAAAAESWVIDGNYSAVRELVWRRATHVVWLDYSRSVVMYRVITRSVARALDQSELWAGNRESWRKWLRPSHPIQWAWSTWRRRRSQYEALIGRAEHGHLTVLRLRRPGEAAGVIERLRST